ncbi:Uncharacterised protein [Corynebacterium minutissimum]|uniref:Uncharacterized protein n=1 Tax=Corynebacterium minutissimum TaxID=38301 RepID=A0A376CW57_9CORY|nr:Uncharacterised protein [Corynebacterium minutissimum]
MQCPHPTKVRYATRKEAAYALLTIWKRADHTKQNPLNIYECQCGYYHLTHYSSQDKINTRKVSLAYAS